MCEMGQPGSMAATEGFAPTVPICRAGLVEEGKMRDLDFNRWFIQLGEVDSE